MMTNQSSWGGDAKRIEAGVSCVCAGTKALRAATRRHEYARPHRHTLSAAKGCTDTMILDPLVPGSRGAMGAGGLDDRRSSRDRRRRREDEGAAQPDRSVAVPVCLGPDLSGGAINGRRVVAQNGLPDQERAHDQGEGDKERGPRGRRCCGFAFAAILVLAAAATGTGRVASGRLRHGAQ